MKPFFFLPACRICGFRKLEKYISLGVLPLANRLTDARSDETDLFFPLEVALCPRCHLSQLTVVVDPEILFSGYAYRTSISLTFQKHFQEMAQTVSELFPDTGSCRVLDIASNDGCLLEQFRARGFRVLGIEPARNLAEIANRQGLQTIPEFWDEKTAKKVLARGFRPKVVTATNVFAHVHDVRGFIRNVKRVLDPEGIFIIEVPHAQNLIEKNEFDTIYHEHLSYFLVKPLQELFRREGMKIFDIRKVATHGGSIRVFAKLPGNKRIRVQKARLHALCREEKIKGLYALPAYKKFAERVFDTRIAFLKLLARLRKQGKTIAGYGAAAKASTLLNYCGIGPETVSFIVDDAPTKQGKAFSGNRVPITSSAALKENHVDYLVLFAWTLTRELIRKTQGMNFRGKYILPLPSPRIMKGSPKPAD
ncbi:MAG: class I SAM-dependent methyltransferase [Candidatus Diapherotrites archaeon]|nr:class I SAM-dependent methyltransferase [Candidatus Diapherotrites archaeon]